MDGPLVGSAAVDAIGIYARLGAANARFDARRVNAAVHSRRGRLRLAGALALCRQVRASVARSSRPRSFRARSAVRRTQGRRAAKSPGRPAVALYELPPPLPPELRRPRRG